MPAPDNIPIESKSEAKMDFDIEVHSLVSSFQKFIGFSGFSKEDDYHINHLGVEGFHFIFNFPQLG